MNFLCSKCSEPLNIIEPPYFTEFRCRNCKTSVQIWDKSREEAYSEYINPSKSNLESDEKIPTHFGNKSPDDAYSEDIHPGESKLEDDEQTKERDNSEKNFKDLEEKKREWRSRENKNILNSLPKKTDLNRSEYFSDILKFVEKSIADDKKFIIINAPTGIGKSHVAATICKYLNEGIILTDQISLQQQYVQEFNWINPVKGMNNFDCPALDWLKDCSHGNCNSCEHRCCSDDFQILDVGTELEKIVITDSSEFSKNKDGKIDSEILLNERNYEIIPENKKIIIASELLSPDEITYLEGSLSTFVIKYNKQYFFVRAEQKIPKDAEVYRSNSELITRRTEICPYYQQRMIGEKASFAVYNYAMYIATMLGKSTDSEDSRSRNVLICDEAHMLEDRLKDQGTISIKLNIIQEVINSDKLELEIRRNVERQNFQSLLSNLKQLLEELTKKNSNYKKHQKCVNYFESKEHLNLHRTNESCTKHKRFLKKCSGCIKLINMMEDGRFLSCDQNHWYSKTELKCNEEHKEFQHKKIRKIKEVKKEIESGLEIIESIIKKYKDTDKNFVFTIIENELNIQPIRVDETAKKLFQNFNCVVFLSSTIHKEIFVQDMGLQNYVERSYPNPIKQDNRIIYKYYVDADKYMEKDSDEYKQRIEKIAQRIIKILHKYKNDRGLILVNSKNNVDELMPHLKDIENRLTYSNNNPTNYNEQKSSNTKLLEKHKNKENSVLLSSSMWEGVDLKEDLGKFCIIARAPYMPKLPKTGPYVHAKNRLRGDEEWMNMKNAFKLVQGCGRCVRGPEEKGTTYLLDGGCQKHIDWLDGFIRKNPNFSWFTDSIRNYEQ